MSKILMVCLGNICRSPLAQGILESKVDSRFVFVDSAGTSGHHEGELPDSRSIEVAKKNGLDISSQRSRKFNISDFKTFDHIYVMDESNYNDLLSIATTKEDKDKVKLILKESNSNSSYNVPDPYYGGESGFENVYKMLDEVCDVISVKFK